LAPLFWLMVGGVPGLIVFKIASTMDSMVGYRNERYLHFGWFGARLDDWLCWLPARLGFVLLGVTALFLPGCSALKAWRIGWRQHGLIPGPNPGWAEATAAGALQVRLIGPLHKEGHLVTEIWIGDPADPEGGHAQDMHRMRQLAQGATFLALMLSVLLALTLAYALKLVEH
jgi:adenosylcobinamide-phosphate synthase